MNNDVSHPLGAGALQIERRLAEEGCEGIVDYSASLGSVGIFAVAESLCVAPIDVQKRYEEEARSAQDPRPVAKDLLFRRLRDVLGGWPATPSWESLKEVRYQLIGWCDLLRRTEFEPIQKEIVHAFLGMVLPPGWLPHSSDDPVIRQLFDEFWPQ